VEDTAVLSLHGTPAAASPPGDCRFRLAKVFQRMGIAPARRIIRRTMAQSLLLHRLLADAPERPATRQMPNPADPDEVLMALAAAGDRTAFGLLAARHGAPALRLACRVLGDLAEAEEVAQEALLRAWQGAAGFDPGRARFATWLHRIVLNLAIDRARRRARAPAAGLDAAEALVDPAPGPEAAAAAAEAGAALARALAALPPRQRAAIALAYEQDLSGAEAAAMLEISERALEGLLHRARHMLRRQLGEG